VLPVTPLIGPLPTRLVFLVCASEDTAVRVDSLAAAVTLSVFELTLVVVATGPN
jgi:hypothetical protein